MYVFFYVHQGYIFLAIHLKEGFMKKRKGKGEKRKKEKSDKHMLKYLYEAYMTAKKIHKNREEF